VESSGFNERTWLDLDGHPHTEELRVTERFRRRDFGHMELQLTLEDPKAYAKPWTVTVPMELAVDTEMLEYVCNENERDRSHMDGTGALLKEVAVASATLAKYAGVYEFNDSGKIHVVEITVSDAALFWNQDGAGKQKLVAFSETAFSLSGTSVLFNADGEFILRAVEEDMKGVRKR